MADYLIHDSTLEDIADAIRSKTGGSSLIAPEDMPTEIASIETGGGIEIENGIVFTELNSSGRPTKADIYGNVPMYAFGQYSASSVLGTNLTNVTFKTQLTEIGYGAFQKTGLTELIIPDSVDTVGGQVLRGNTAAIRYVHENAGAKYGYNGGALSALAQIASLASVQLGAIGKPVTALYYQFMTPRAYASVTLTIYCIGSNVDSFLTQARQAVTGGTIVFKASEATEYNGTSYAAGDTILTSEVTS